MATDIEYLQLTAKRKVLLSLRQKLNNECGALCPAVIAHDHTGSVDLWTCDDCFDNFSWLLTRAHNVPRDVSFKMFQYAHCPCGYTFYADLNPEILFLRLDEVIKEIEERLMSWQLDPYTLVED